MAQHKGYDSLFLGLTVSIPVPDAPTVKLDYVHFTVRLRPDRRLAAVTAVNIHGGLLVEIERTRDTWILDPRVPAAEQAGPALYTANDFDRGHLVRRRDPGWGTAAVAKSANDDTFHYTNAAPQAARLNQSPELWAGLEDYLLEHAATYDERLCVFTGPVLAATDPVYRGVQIPLRFYKIAAWLQHGTVSSTGYILDQIDLVQPILDAEAALNADAEPLGAFKTFQVPVQDIAELAGLNMPTLVAADVFAPVAAGALLRDRPWNELHAASDTVLR